ncbi:MAG: YceI family protein [Bdellovibrionaceae bacterium]|nr:YceI family protein [Pseudobdellovibrionaceae bacterium]
MRMLKHTFVALALIAVAGQAQAADKKVAKAVTPAAMKLDPATSEIKWEGSKKIIKSAHSGTVKLKSGEIQMTGDQVTSGNFEIDMTTITNTDLASSPKDQAKLVGHLKSEDFFSVEKHTTASFKITSAKTLKPAKAGDPTHEITGDLTIKGKTNKVTFPAVVTTTEGRTEAKANIVIDRTQWDVRYGSGKFFENLGDKVIADEIKFDVKLIATKS